MIPPVSNGVVAVARQVKICGGDLLHFITVVTSVLDVGHECSAQCMAVIART
jgi:hypothetical protein